MIQRIERDKKNFYTDYEVQLHKEQKGHYLNYANFYIYENFLSPNEVTEVQKLMASHEHRTTAGSVIGYNETDSKMFRDSSILFLDDVPDFNEWDVKIRERAEEVNRNVWNLDLTASMHPQYTEYGVNQYFNWHPDGPFGVMDTRGLNCIPKDLLWRKLSMSLLLNNESEYKGGDFQISQASSSPECNSLATIRADAGTAIFFPAFSAHRVTPVTESKRKTIVYWFCGPRWK